MKPVLITGAAGFIGYHSGNADISIRAGPLSVSTTSMTYYDLSLKQARLRGLQERPGFRFVRGDLSDGPDIDSLFTQTDFDIVVNLAGQAGVRYSLENPQSYVKSNVEGFVNILEACRRHAVGHLVYASSSSVYGANTAMPFSVHQNADHPVSLYGATKRSNELLAHSYSHLFGLPTTGLRFFTVYGPWNRPDMAIYLFAKAILAGEPIKVFNHGRMERDFTYVDDIAEGILRLGDRPAAANPAWDGKAPDPGSSSAPWRIYNIGNNSPVTLSRLIGLLEQNLGREAMLSLLPMQPGDVPATYADIDDLGEAIGFRPSTTIEDGVARFCAWFRHYHGPRQRPVEGAPNGAAGLP